MVHNQSQSFILDLLIIRMLYLGLITKSRTGIQRIFYDITFEWEGHHTTGGTRSFQDFLGHHIKTLQQLPTVLVNTVLRYLA